MDRTEFICALWAASVLAGVVGTLVLVALSGLATARGRTRVSDPDPLAVELSIRRAA